MKKFILGLILVLSFVGCSSLVPKQNDKLVGKEYVLATTNEDYKISLNFSEENFFGFAGVNNYFGKFSTDENNIYLGNVGVTMMAGPEKVMLAEQNFLKDLNEVKTFKSTKDKLTLFTSTGKTLVFKLVERPTLKK